MKKSLIVICMLSIFSGAVFSLWYFGGTWERREKKKALDIIEVIRNNNGNIRAVRLKDPHTGKEYFFRTDIPILREGFRKVFKYDKLYKNGQPVGYSNLSLVD